MSSSLTVRLVCMQDGAVVVQHKDVDLLQGRDSFTSLLPGCSYRVELCASFRPQLPDTTVFETEGYSVFDETAGEGAGDMCRTLVNGVCNLLAIPNPAAPQASSIAFLGLRIVFFATFSVHLMLS